MSSLLEVLFYAHAYMLMLLSWAHFPFTPYISLGQSYSLS